MTKEAGQPAYYFEHPEARNDRAVDYSLHAEHGWEYLLDNHLENENSRREAITHMAVLGEN